MNQSSETEEKNIYVSEEEMKRLNQEMITSELITPDRLYLDLVLVKDINIGTILSFLKERKPDISQEEYVSLYEKIINTLPSYGERAFDDLAHIFSFMNLTNEQIKARMHDEKYAGWIIHHSPITKYINTLNSQLAVNINHSAVIGKRDPIEITINTYPLHLSKEDEFIIGFYFSDRFKVNVKVTYIDMKKVRLSTIFPFDEIYTYYFKEIFDSEEIRKAYSELKFINKRLYVTRLFGEKIVPEKNIDHEALFIQSRLDILTKFHFVHPRIFSAPPPIITKETAPNG